jgi:hypothetical protein
MKDVACKILEKVGVTGTDAQILHTPERAGSCIGEQIRQRLAPLQNHVVLLMDETESIKDTLLREFLELFLPGLYGALKAKGKKLRVILAGQYVSDWENEYSKLRLELIRLAPFNFSSVYQTVENFSPPDIELEYKQDFASYLMYFTGGHPGCMAQILHQDFGQASIVILKSEEQYYTEIVRPAINEIKKHIRGIVASIVQNEEAQDALETMFDTLSVLRYFEPLLLDDFLQRDLIIWPDRSVYELETLLLATSLISKSGGFLQDGITRRLLAISLRKTNKLHFIKACEQAMAFYHEKLSSISSYRRDMMAVEYLFQFLQYHVYKKRGSKDSYLEQIRNVVESLAPEPDIHAFRPVLDGFLGLLKNDWEFRFNFNYLFRGQRYDDDLYQQLIDEVTKCMRERLQGE